MFWGVGYPVEFGRVDWLARPGRNVTGLTWVTDEGIYLKRFQQLPRDYVLTLNLKTARELGFTVPQIILLRADHVIE